MTIRDARRIMHMLTDKADIAEEFQRLNDEGIIGSEKPWLSEAAEIADRCMERAELMEDDGK